MDFFDDKILKVLLDEKQIQSKVKEMGELLTKEYADPKRELIMVCVLRGSLVFASDLIRQINRQVLLDTIVVSSYGETTRSSGVVKINKDLEQDIAGKDVLIVEDIVDTGLTIGYLKKYLAARDPHSVKVCTFLDKPERRVIDVDIEYKGFEVPNEFVVGYGLDYNQLYRNYPKVAVLKPEAYE